MAEGDFRLGKVAFVDKGIYSAATTYNTFDFVVTDDSCYLSLKDNNTGHAVTDTARWKCIARGTQATEASKTALDAANKALNAKAGADTATASATQQAANANAAAGSANTATDAANTIIANLATKEETIDALIPQLSTAIRNAVNAYNLIASVPGVDVFSRVPAAMVVECITECVIGATPVINVKMSPETANSSRIFQLASPNGEVLPNGTVTSNLAVPVKVNVVSTQNSSLWETVTVNFRPVVSRTTEDGTARTMEDGTTIEC